MKLSEYLHNRVAESGVTHAFGVPGSFVMPIWQRFTDAPRVVLARHESGAVFMADGNSRATGRLGVAVATIGPGITNLVTGVTCAYRDSIPLLVVTGQAPTRTFGRGGFLESYHLDRSVAPHQILGPLTKRSLEVVDLDNARFLIDTALGLTRAGRPGPVHLSIPLDLQDQHLPETSGVARAAKAGVSVSASASVSLYTSASEGDGLTVARAELASARRPLLLAGWGTYLSSAGPDVLALAQEVDGVIVSTTKALACFTGAEPAVLGHLGPGQRPDLAEAMSSYDPDVVLVVGASLSQYYTASVLGLLERAFVIRVDVDADQLGSRLVPDVALHGDAKMWLAALHGAAPTRNPSPDRTGAQQTVAAFQTLGERAAAAQALAFGGQPSMTGIIARLRAMLPDDAVVIPDAGNHWLDTLALHRPKHPGGLLVNCGHGAMGWAIGAAVGVAFDDRDRTTVCVTGDASMLMHGTELSVAAEHGLNLLAIVFNNRSHGRVRLGQQQGLDGNPLASDVPPVDFAQWASAMGLASFTAADPAEVEPAVAAALAAGGTAVVDVECHPDEVPAPLRNWIGDAP